MSSTSFSDILAKTWSHNILFSVLLELTYRCNLGCVYCYNDLKLRGQRLSLEDYRQLLEDLASLQVLNLTLSGGEPLMHPEFFAIGGMARELGFLTRIKSNGHLLDRALATRVRDEVDPFVIDLSLHGASPQTHDRMTRIPGSFERLMQNIQHMKELGLRLKLNCTLTAWNEHEVEQIFVLADSLDVLLHCQPEVSPRDDGDLSPLQLSASAQGVAQLLRLIHASSESRVTVGREGDEDMPSTIDKNCGAGSSGLAIDPYGNVYPCVQWRRPVGNLHESRIPQIWQGNPQLSEIRELTKQAKKVVESQGPHAPAMSFCLGLAELYEGDPLAIYPAAQRRLDHYRSFLVQLES